jgi:hypothetical protein
MALLNKPKRSRTKLEVMISLNRSRSFAMLSDEFWVIKITFNGYKEGAIYLPLPLGDTRTPDPNIVPIHTRSRVAEWIAEKPGRPQREIAAV